LDTKRKKKNDGENTHQTIQKLNVIFGGYETSLLIHKRIGILMIACFVIHTLYLLSRINWKDLGTSVFGPDSLVPNLQDFKHLWQRTLWLFGLGSPPKLGRWTYWEKFDYWAVFWGMPLLAITGLMLMYPLLTSRFMPGWILNVAALLHRAEAILAVTYIFIVHFFIGHLRPSSFPMNEAMFSGSVINKRNHIQPVYHSSFEVASKPSVGLRPRQLLRFLFMA